MPATADSRAVLRDALRQSLDGDETAEIVHILPCPSGLSQLEKSAWLMLQNWSCDAPLRNSHLSHAQYSRERLNHLLLELQ